MPILMYHDIRPMPGPDDPVGQDLTVTPRTFALQMDYLAKHGFHPITLRQLAEARAHKFALPSRPIVLTFDDGHQNFYTNAWPVLRKDRFSSTIFIITGLVGHKWFLTWREIRRLDSSGLVEVASHTVSHSDLPALNHDQARYEIFESKRTLESRLGHPIRTFSYPGGRYDAQDVALVRAAGYRLAVTTHYGYAIPKDNPFELPRVRIHGKTSLAGFASQLPK